ncbi:MAG TPA: AAA family ATPase [Azospirillum sp.]
MTPIHYVQTAAIKAAVEGREQDVFNAVGIDWHGGRGHITCPYPDHGGKNDWRWDAKKACAYCTCIGKRPGDGKAHSIFDVVSTMENCDFETAKVRVAEIIGRSDLIQTEGRANSERQFQATDAAGLLNPPIENRDDALVAAYLASRLGISPGEVPLPATRVVGIKALPYYDAPAREGLKPKLVGTYPCAIFETVSVDGRQHALRIYLAPGGQGKADLSGRDPKKSARTKGGTTTAGCATLWGNPLVAPHTIVCEGIETGAAIAFSMRDEIAAGTVMVAAAVSAGGVEAFRPYAATKHVTVAADRDEKGSLTKPASRRGEIAARKLALALHEQVPISIAMPGEAGEKVDWLDILRRGGVDAVRAGMKGAVPFMPTVDEMAATHGDTGTATKAPAGDRGTGRRALPRVRFHEVMPVLETKDLVQGLLTSSAMSVVYGDSNAGKTFVVLDLALHVALGCSWRDKRVVRGGVVYVAAEGGAGIKNRVAAFREHHGIAGTVPFTIVPSSINLLDPDADTDALIDLIQDESDDLGIPVTLIVIDTLSRAMAGGNENASEDMGALVMNADRIRQETGAHLMFIHHTGKDAAKGARGHSLLRAATDTEIEVARAQGARTGTITVTKQRDLDIKPPLAFTLQVVELGVNAHAEPVSSCVVEAQEYSGTSKGKTAKRKSFNELHLQALMNALADKGEIVVSTKVPRVMSIPINAFYDALRAQGSIGAEKRDTELKQGQRIIHQLRATGLAATGSDRIWLTDAGQQGGAGDSS